MESLEISQKKDVPTAEIFAKFLCSGHDTFTKDVNDNIIKDMNKSEIIIPRFEIKFQGIDNANSQLISNLRREVRAKTSQSPEIQEIVKIANANAIVNSVPEGKPETEYKKIGHVSISKDQQSYISDIRFDGISEVLS